jgi:hypothetical protein
MADKSYESYEMLAKLLNSGRKENIDSVYDALSEVITGEYQRKKQENKDTYADKRNALAKNRAKAEKYLDYFMTEKGYNGSGIEADAKLKASLGYNSDLGSLYAAEALSASDIDSEYVSAKLKNEAERNEKKAESDKDYADALYKAYGDDRQMALKRDQFDYQKESDEKDRAIKRDQFDYQKESDEKDRSFKRDQFDYQKESDEKDRSLKRDQFDYQKESDEKDRSFKREQFDYQKESDEKDRELKQTEQQQKAELERQKLRNDSEYRSEQLRLENEIKQKETEIKRMQAETDAAKVKATTDSQKSEAEEMQAKVNAYRQLLYNDIKAQFDMTDDLDEKQRIYDSVTGVNAENAAEIYGETLYKNMIKEFSKDLTEAKIKKADEAVVQKLYDRFVNAKDEYHYETYMKLKRELQFGNFPGFTEDQLERAYKAYLKNN